MRVIFNINTENIELQASDVEGKYFVSINDKLSFEYQDGKLSQEYVPSKAMNGIMKEAKEKESAGESKEEIAKRLSEKEKEEKKRFFYTVVDKEGNSLTEKLDEMISRYEPKYDL